MVDAHTGGLLMLPGGAIAMHHKYEYGNPSPASYPHAGALLTGVRRESALYDYNNAAYDTDVYGWALEKEALGTWSREGPFHYRMTVTDEDNDDSIGGTVRNWKYDGVKNYVWRVFRCGFTLTGELRCYRTTDVPVARQIYARLRVRLIEEDDSYNELFDINITKWGVPGQLFTLASDPFEVVVPGRVEILVYLYPHFSIGLPPSPVGSYCEFNVAGLPIGDCEDSTLVSETML